MGRSGVPVRGYPRSFEYCQLRETSASITGSKVRRNLLSATSRSTNLRLNNSDLVAAFETADDIIEGCPFTLGRLLLRRAQLVTDVWVRWTMYGTVLLLI